MTSLIAIINIVFFTILLYSCIETLRTEKLNNSHFYATAFVTSISVIDLIVFVVLLVVGV